MNKREGEIVWFPHTPLLLPHQNEGFDPIYTTKGFLTKHAYQFLFIIGYSCYIKFNIQFNIQRLL